MLQDGLIVQMCVAADNNGTHTIAVLAYFTSNVIKVTSLKRSIT